MHQAAWRTLKSVACFIRIPDGVLAFLRAYFIPYLTGRLELSRSLCYFEDGAKGSLDRYEWS